MAKLVEFYLKGMDFRGTATGEEFRSTLANILVLTAILGLAAIFGQYFQMVLAIYLGTIIIPTFSLCIRRLRQIRSNVGHSSQSTEMTTMTPSGNLAFTKKQPIFQHDSLTKQLNIACFLMKSKRYEESIQVYIEIAESHSEMKGLCAGQIGSAMYSLGKYREALKYCKIAISYGADKKLMQFKIAKSLSAMQNINYSKVAV